MKKQYYSLSKILKENADYNLIIGERSNGKSYALLEKTLNDYISNKSESVYLRRWKDDIIGKRAQTLFEPFTERISEMTNNEWETVIFARGGYHLARRDLSTKKFVADPTSFCKVLALSDMEHDKSTSYPKVKNIIFDEFLTRRYYLPDEFVIFMNVLSTIIRDRTDVQIFMLGNTVNKFCPYFEEMGLKNIENQQQGTIDVYNFANKLKIAVEYCGTVNKTKKSNKYFAFDNPRLNMITNGKWELGIYRHLPQGYKIKPTSICFSANVEFTGKIITLEIVVQNDVPFIFAHPKTTAVKDNEILYSQTLDISPYRRACFLYPIDSIDKAFATLYGQQRIFYSSNDVGEILHNFLLSCTH